MKILCGIYNLDTCIFDGKVIYSREVTVFEKNIKEAFQDHDVIYFSIKNADITYDPVKENFHDILAKLPPDFQPDAVIIFYLEYNILPLKLEESPYPLIAFPIDMHLCFSTIKDILGIFDYIFTYKDATDILKRFGYQNVEYMTTLAMNPLLHRITDTPKTTDVLFIGSTNYDRYRDRNEYLKRLALLSNKYKIKITSGLFGEDYVNELNSARITFNKSAGSEINMRAFEACACGSLLFYEEDNKEIRDYFTDRVHCVLYNENNFEKLIEYYLNNDDERELICKNALEKVAGYTYKNHFNNILNRIQELLPSLSRNRRFINLPEIKKHNFRALHLIPSIYQGSVDFALSEMEQAFKTDPHDCYTLNNYGCILAYSNKFDQAIDLQKQSIEISSLHILPLFNLANIYFKLKNEKCIGYFNRLISVLKDKPDDIVIEGIYYLAEYNYFRMEWEKAHKQNEPSKFREDIISLLLYESYMKSGLYYFSLNNYNQSVDSLNDAAKHKDDSHYVYGLLADNYKALGIYDMAIESLQKAISLAPLIIEYRKNLIDLYNLTQKDFTHLIKEFVNILNAFPVHQKEFYLTLKSLKAKK